MARPKKNSNTQALADKMRKAVLQAAIEGKLTERHKDDGDARELLAQVETEKQRLVKAGEIKRQKSLPDITEEEKLFDIPDNWEWVRLGDIGSWSAGSTPSRTESKYYTQGNIHWLKTGDLNDGFITDTSERITELALEKTSVTLQPIGAVLIAMYGATIGKLGLLEIESTTNQACCGCTVFEPVYNYYLFYFLLANRKRFIEMGAGGAQPNISKDKIINTVMPLPPLAEQQRIVAKLQEVMPQLDNLSADEDALYALQTAFPKQIQASLLQAAIEGKLTQQDAIKDGHASELLSKIEIEKQRLIDAGEIKRSKTLPPITEEEKPFDIPDNWEWVRLDQLSIYIQRGRSPKYSSIEEIPVISQKCVQWTGFSLELAKFIDPETKEKYQPERFLQDGDLLWNSTGLGTVGRVAKYREERNKYDIAVADSHVTVIRLLKQYVLPEYVELFISSPIIQQNIEDICSGSTKQKELATSTAKNTVLPLPPLAEQQRIVDLLEQALPEIQTLKEI